MKLPKSTMENILKKAGIGIIGEDAKEALQEALNKKIEAITKKSAEFSKHRGRKTITKEDIGLVIS